MNLDPDQIVELAWRQLWQVTAIAFVAAVAMRWTCRRRPHLAYLLGLVVLVKCWTPPIWSSRAGVFCRPERSASMASGIGVQRLPPTGVVREDRSALPIEQGPHRDVAYEPPVFAAAPQAKPSSSLAPAVALFSAWLLVAMGYLAVAGVQWSRWRHELRPFVVAPPGRLSAVAHELAEKFALRYIPRVWVTGSSTGPAVFGLWWPTIVIPQRLLADDAAESLEMALAHEMAHIRRGDLWVGMFQFATQAVWWFHPLIWWTCRQMTHERERACDEAVLAALRCPPRRYAQCLLDVLRLKRQPALLAFPGMRAAGVTQQRLEHIMRSNDFARSRTPFRYWLLAALAGCAVLPGAPLTVAVSADEKSAQARKTDEAPAAEGSDRASPRNEVAGAETKAESGSQKTDRIDSDVDDAIERGIRFLKVEQRDDGSWEDPVGYPGGITGLCTLTLLKWGVKADERPAKTALTFLRKFRPSMTYSTALQTLVFCAADANDDRKLIQRNVEWLAAQQKLNVPMAGAWGYPQAEGDNSNTAFAIWALYEADQKGVKVGNAVWRRTLDYWLAAQNTNGSWGYKPGLGGTGSMTSQGLFCVAAAAKVLGEDKPDQPAAGSIEKAKAWLGRNFSAHVNPGSHGQQGWLLYYLLACSKAGHISDNQNFGKHDWFAEGAEKLLDDQREDGSWKGTGHAEDDPHLATSLALLFLLQGRVDK
ncbi:MAG TPA: M56 family metallopeptidase [Pirellulales bacterium]|nr:M56 family metallopeptidase [Pirellulales bacterium]